MVQPPVPPPPASMPPPPAGPPAYGPPQQPLGYAPPQQRKTSPVWYIVGCGCLVLLLLTGVGGYFGYKAYQSKIAPALKTAVETPTTPTTETTSTPTETTTTTKAPAEPAVNEQPGKEAALKAALAGQSGWIGKINYASSDWQRVKVWIGPPNSEFTTAVVLQWNGNNNAYQVESSSAIPSNEPAVVIERQPTVIVERKPTVIVRPAPRRNPLTPPNAGVNVIPPRSGSTEKPTGPSQAGPRPNIKRAIHAAVAAAAPEPGWIGRLSSSRDDLENPTIMIGPKNSEFVLEVRLHWDSSRHRYNVVGTSNIGN